MQDIEALDQAAKAELERIAALPTVGLKDKMSIPPQRGATLPHREYRTTMDESTSTLTMAQARLEASRCMNCKKPFCTAACPIGMPIPQYLELLAGGNVEAAVKMIRGTSLLPAICSRVCPHEKQCQSSCAMGRSLKDMNKGIHMGETERFCIDYEREHMGGKPVPEIAASTGKKIAVVGSGPSGFAAAVDLRTLGHDVTIFEAYDQLGGVLRYGIPQFRLPKDIVDYEYSILPKMGIEVKTGVTVGKDVTIEELFKQGYDAVFMGNGAGQAMKTGTKGEDLKCVYTAEEYLKKGNRGEAIESGKNVVVVGGGNVAMDACRMAFRLGAETVHCVYRRTVNEMPACKAELCEILNEGVFIKELRNPAEFIADENGRVAKAILDKFKLGEPDEKGRPRPVKIEGETEEIACDTVVLAIGSRVSDEIKNTTAGLETNKNGTYIVKAEGSFETTVKNVFTAGDAKHGPLTVVMAMKTGRDAAVEIHKALMG
ncbi:MAG: NAD(P)-dependent oxidoreductase [Fibrobacter sp.]|nr:NAD(P)-dependent oxidoreductase [Fibrobacter sp.]